MADANWEKSPPELADAFAAEVAVRPDLAMRKMFGYPAAFLAGLHVRAPSAQSPAAAVRLVGAR